MEPKIFGKVSYESRKQPDVFLILQPVAGSDKTVSRSGQKNFCFLMQYDIILYYGF